MSKKKRPPLEIKEAVIEKDGKKSRKVVFTNGDGEVVAKMYYNEKTKEYSHLKEKVK